jgi:hypothetical protein
MKIRMRVLATVVCAAALTATGCGNLTIRSWVKLVTAESSGTVTAALLGPPVPINRLQGGFLGAIVLDTTSLPGPVDGTVTVDDVRIAGDTAPSILGAVCIWGDPANPSSGTINLDILGGSGSTTLTLNLRASATLAERIGVPPVALSQTATFPLTGIGLTQLLNASVTGSGDGLFATGADFVGDTTIAGTPATFALTLKVNNDSTPPLFDADLLTKCGKHFNEQGRDIFYGVNSKGSYLLAKSDQPVAPTVIALADIGAKPGNQLKIARVGTYNDATELRDGNATKMAAVFSSSNVVKSGKNKARIPGAIDAGTDVTTPAYVTCIIWPFCTSTATDIPEDFAVTNSPTVTIPAGAQYLIVAPTPDSLKWGDNSGFGLGVSLTVNP